MADPLSLQLRAIARLASDMAVTYREDELTAYAEDISEAHEGLLAVLDHLTAPVQIIGVAGEP